MRIFAIGFKNWVELRSYNKPPVPETDEIITESHDRQVIGYDYNGTPMYRTIKIPWTIKAIHYPGGKVIETLKTNRLKSLGLYVADQQCVELTKAQLKILVEHSHSKLTKYAK